MCGGGEQVVGKLKNKGSKVDPVISDSKTQVFQESNLEHQTLWTSEKQGDSKWLEKYTELHST